MNRKSIAAALAVGVASGVLAFGTTGVQAQETVLRMVTAFPKPVPINRPVDSFIEKVNEQGKGVVRIQLLGGPEVTPPPDQPQALRNGVFDILYFPTNYALGTVAEGDALVGSNRTAAEVRENGGWELLQEAFRTKMNTHLLSWPGTNFRFHIFTAKEPRLADNGEPDLSGVRIRAVPIYREVLSLYGATPVSIHIPEVYTALERGIVAGAGFPIHSIRILSWHEHLSYRIDPGFFNGDGVFAINLDSWNRLSGDAQKLLTEIAVAHEKEAAEFFEKIVADEDKELRKAGMKVIELEGEARSRFLSRAYGVAWDRLAKQDAEAAKTLREKFYRE